MSIINKIKNEWSVAIFWALALFACIVFWLTIIILVQKDARAEEFPDYYGQDYLGVHHNLFPCDLVLKHFPVGMSLGILSDPTFGDSDACFRRILRQKKPQILRAHLLNNTAVRNRKTQRQEPLFNYTLDRLAREVRNPNSPVYTMLAIEISKINNAVAVESPTTLQLLSPFLESDLNQSDTNTLFRILREKFPGQNWVHNPVNKNVQTPQGVIRELHYVNSPPKAEITSHDGTNFADTDWEEVKENTGLVFMTWSPRMNLRVNQKDRNNRPIWTAPRARTWALREGEIRLAIESARFPDTFTEYPSVCGGAKTWSRVELYKTMSDDHGKGDPKDGKPLLITYDRRNLTSRNYAPVIVYASNGVEISKLNYYGTYSEGGFRYYDTVNDAFSLGTKARELTGNATIFLKSPKGRCYRVNAFRRSPYYR